MPIPGGTDCTASLKCAAGRGTGSFLRIYANLPIVRSSIAGSTPLKGRQAEFFKYQAPRSEPRRICSFTWHPIYQRFHPIPRKSPAEAARPKGGPEWEVWNLRFQRFFGYFLFAQKVTAGHDCAMTPSRGHAQLDSARPLDVAVQNPGAAQAPGYRMK